MSDSAGMVAVLPPTNSENEDRFSDLPESVILHTLSFLNTKHAVQTCVLSTRWKDLWKRVPSLTLHYLEHVAYKKFPRLVSKVLSCRDSSISLHSLEFYRGNCHSEPDVKKVVNYALSHNVQRLALCFILEIPSTVFSCQTLTHLKLHCYDRFPTLFPKSFNLPALTNLQLEFFEFCVEENGCAEPFSTFNRLDSLIMYRCIVNEKGTLCISSATLVNLTISNYRWSFIYKVDLCSPSLCNFAFNGNSYLELSGSSVSSLSHVDIDVEVYSCHKKDPIESIINLLRQFTNLKSLTVSPTTLQVLSLYPNVLEIKLPSLHNLKSLKVKMEDLSIEFCLTMFEFRWTLMDAKIQKATSKREVDEIRKAFKLAELEPPSLIPDGMVEFLLQNSPFAKVDYIDCSKRQFTYKHIFFQG